MSNPKELFELIMETVKQGLEFWIFGEDSKESPSSSDSKPNSEPTE